MDSRNITRAVMFAVSVSIVGCSSYKFDQNVETINQDSNIVYAGEVIAARDNAQQRVLNERARLLLANELSESNAVELMLAKSPAFQSLLFENLVEGSLAAQSARIINPTLSLERTVHGTETEFGRFLTFGLIDLATLPSRQAYADLALNRASVNLESNIYTAVTDVRLAWLNAVAAENRFSLVENMTIGLSASADLAKRMKQAGSMTTVDRIQQQLLFSDATIMLAEAKQKKLSTREGLIQLLGLSGDETERLRLPKDLTDIPDKPLDLASLVKNFEERLDVKAARLDYEQSLQSLGIKNISTYTDIELGLRSDRIDDDGSISTKRGFELEVTIPVFDWGDLQREALHSNVMAQRSNFEQTAVDAASQLRVAYSAYRTAFDIAKHYQNEIVPLHETLLDEANYNYNGMIIGVFDLLQAGVEKSLVELRALDSKHNVLMSSLSLQSVAIGKPVGVTPNGLSASVAKQDEEH